MTADDHETAAGSPAADSWVAYGHGARVTAEDERGETDPDRQYRPSTTGRSGPH